MLRLSYSVHVLNKIEEAAVCHKSASNSWGIALLRILLQLIAAASRVLLLGNTGKGSLLIAAPLS